MDAATYAELEQAATAAAEALTPAEADLAAARDRKIAAHTAYKEAEIAREAAFRDWNTVCKQHAIDAATGPLTDSSLAEEEQLAKALVAARNVWRYMGASDEASMQYAMRAVESACGKDEEHISIPLGEA